MSLLNKNNNKAEENKNQVVTGLEQDAEMFDLEELFNDTTVEAKVQPGINKGTIVSVEAKGLVWAITVNTGLYNVKVHAFDLTALLAAASAVYDTKFNQAEELVGKEVQVMVQEQENGHYWTSLNLMDAGEYDVEFVRLRMYKNYYIVVTKTADGFVNADVHVVAEKKDIEQAHRFLNNFALNLGMAVGQRCNYQSDMDCKAGTKIHVNYDTYTKKDGTTSKTKFFTYFYAPRAEENKPDTEAPSDSDIL